ncbi:MAG: SPOR domain-containing protein [Alphaproteobacteria bacterium]|nr:SPOR domain-containing protein [Alphaproteobacteria bacterium]
MSETDRRGGAYAPPPDDYETFDARDAEQDRRGWLFLGAAAVVFILFVAVVWNTFQLGVREREDSPVIAADAEPYRVPPADPGGYEAPDQDLAVTQLREGGADEASADQPVAQPRDTTEEPVDPPAREMPDVTIETTDADALDDEPASPPAADPEPARQDPEPEPARADPQPRPAPSQPAPTLPAASSSGPFVAQIAAYRSEGDAESGWLSFASRFPELASGRAPDIQRADLGDRGVFHRLRIAGFETREDAAAFCEALDARGQACLVARR